MQITLTPHGQELVEAALARGIGGGAPEEIVERALEKIALEQSGEEPSLVKMLRELPPLTEEEQQRRNKAVEDMLAFGKKHHFKLNRGGQSWRDFLHEGHKY